MAKDPLDPGTIELPLDTPEACSHTAYLERKRGDANYPNWTCMICRASVPEPQVWENF